VIRIASSLTNRIFLASTLLAILSLGFAFAYVNQRASSEIEADLERGLAEAATMVDRNRALRTDQITRMARVTADAPTLKAAVSTNDPPTVQRLVPEFLEFINADLLVITDPKGAVLASAGNVATPIVIPTDADQDEFSTFVKHERGVLQVITVPVLTGPPPTQALVGRLTAGFFMDDGLAREFKGVTDSEIAFAAEGHVRASSLGPESFAVLDRALATTVPTTIQFGGEEYVALARPMHQGEGDIDRGAITLTLRSRTERLRFLNTLQAGLVAALVVTILFSTILSYAVARTMTRPLAAVTGAMGDLAVTGDLTRKVPVQSRAWDDADARLLASAFNTLTESIARFQREAAQKERLSSLGRLSTVIAHEIRNPLMIIRATLTSLRREHVSAADRLEAAADIDEETTRLNHVVSDVLDFAKPLRFDLAPANLNDVCRASASAAWAGQADGEVQFDLDPEMPIAVTDAERMRTALVNILTNARHAVHAAAGTPDGRGGGSSAFASATADTSDPPSGDGAIAVANQPGVIVRTRYAAGRVAITVQDHGTGIGSDDLAHIFDPYFTTRRKGTGLGLPIAKNIIEGLGGSIAVTSQLGEGTEIRLDLPLTAESTA
jgi:signal transduction histidine kinase